MLCECNYNQGVHSHVLLTFLEHDEEPPLSIEEENSCSTDGVPVYSDNPPSQSSPGGELHT